MAKSKKFGRNLIEDTSQFDILNNKLEKKVIDSSYNLPVFEGNLEEKNSLMDYQKLKLNALEMIKDGALEFRDKDKEKLILSKRNSN